MHPGPDDLRFAICNPTSLTHKADAFSALRKQFHCHFIAASETSATQPVQGMASRQMRQLGYHSAFTTAAPSLRARADQQISLRGKATGRAAFCVAPLRHTRCSQQLQPGLDLRLLHVIVDEWKIQFVILYGLAQSNSGAQEFNDALLATATQRVEQVNLPAIILGDFNADVHKLPSAHRLARLGFLHLQQLFTNMYGGNMPPTCKEATNPDTAFISPILLPRVKAISVLQEPLFDAHKVVLFDLYGCSGNLTKQVWPKPKPFTDLIIDRELFTQADVDLAHVPPPCDLEEWGQRVEHTVDVALRKAPAGANLPRHLPRAFRGRCLPQKPKQILITSLVPKARSGDFEPDQEIHRVVTAGMIKQLRRIQSLRRKLSKEALHHALLLEWRCILRFRYQAQSFVAWLQSQPELYPVPWNLPTMEWLNDLDQLWRHEVQRAMNVDSQIFQDKQKFRLQLDKKQGHNKLTFASVRGSTPKLESVEQTCEQDAILVPLSTRVHSKSHARYEAFVPEPSAFQQGRNLCLDNHLAWIHDIREQSIIVSCPAELVDLENVQVRQNILVTNPQQICHHLTQFWEPIWQRDDAHLHSPALDVAFQQFLNLLPCQSLQVDSKNLEVWKQVIRALKWNAAPGPDGITAFELQTLPDSLISMLIQVVHSYPDGFPSWFMEAKVFAAPKTHGTPVPDKIRPITVLSQLYRVWAQVVCRQLLSAFGKFMTCDITGLLPGRGAFEAAYATQYFFEEAHAAGEPCAGITLDLVKCFNAINRSRGVDILRHLGVPEPILAQWSGSLAKLSRRWEVLGQCSDPISSTCGFPEGDVFSVLVMLGVAQCWTAACRTRTTDSALISAYADNWAWAVKDVLDIEPLLDVTVRWTKIIGLQIDWTKTWWWTSHSHLAGVVRQAFDHLRLPEVAKVQAASDLGCPLRYQGAARMCKLHDRLSKAKERLTRLKVSHVDIDVKAQVISASVYPVAFHGSELFPVGQQHTRSLRHHVAEALVGPSESMASALVTLCASKYVKDPELHMILSACAAARRFLLARDCFQHQRFFKLASQYLPRPNTSKGPASTLKTYLVRLGWSIDSQGYIQVSSFVKLCFLYCPWNSLVWFAERAWQDKLLVMHSHRRSLINFPNVDQHLTRQVLSRFTVAERRLLVREIAGAFQTRSQQAIWDEQVTPDCPWCGQVDTKFHRFFECAATQHVRSPFQALIQEITSDDTLLPELPVIFESVEDEFRFTFQYAIKPRSPEPSALAALQECVSPLSPLHVYTDGSCLHPTIPSLRYAGFSIVVDSCHSDAERSWHAQRFKELGVPPPTLHVIVQELCPQAQNIHHAELRAVVRASEYFSNAVIHVDSSSAIATFEAARTVHGVHLHRHPHPELCCQIQQLNHVETNRLVKIKAHTKPQDLPDLLCYHALGNMIADRAAAEVCTSCHPTLTDEWHLLALQRKQEMDVLEQFYRLSLALQSHRKLHDQHVPASLNPMEPHPMRQAAHFSSQCSNWTVDEAWQLDVAAIRVDNCFDHSYWSSSLMHCILDWAGQIRWPLSLGPPTPVNIGVSWMELVLSFMLYTQCYLPVHRKVLPDGHCFAWARSDAEAHAFNYSWNEVASQFSSMFSQFASLSGHEVLPAHAKRARICALYRQGAGSCVFGLVPRPAFPNQDQVATIVQMAFQKHFRTCAYNWWPPLVLSHQEMSDSLQWQAPAGSWNKLQKKLKEGSRIARRMRSTLETS